MSAHITETVILTAHTTYCSRNIIEGSNS